MKPARVAAAAAAAAWLLATAAAQAPAADTPAALEPAVPEDSGAALPDDPVKPLVYAPATNATAFAGSRTRAPPRKAGPIESVE